MGWMVLFSGKQLATTAPPTPWRSANSSLGDVDDYWQVCSWLFSIF